MTGRGSWAAAGTDAGRGASRDEFERVDMAGPNHGEVPTVERGDGGDPEAFGQSDDAGVDQSQPEIGVGLDQLHATLPVGVVQVGAVSSAELTERKNAASAAGPRRSSINQELSTITVVGTISSLPA